MPQPKIKNLAHRSSEMSLPAVPAQFNLVSRSQSKPKMEVEPIQKEDIFDSAFYAEKIKSIPKDARPDPKNPFMESSAKPVINFKNCKLENSKSTCDLIKPIVEIPSKKRKYKIEIKDFEPLEPEPSTSGSSTLKISKSVEGNSPKRSPTESKKNGAEGNSEMQNKRLQKREMGEVYLKLVSSYFKHRIMYNI